jgi:anti-anti-sigma factor
MPDEFAQLLRAATGAGDRFRIAVRQGNGAPVEHEFAYPYAVVGRGEGCDIVLSDPQVSFRHAYFQIIEGRVFCVDLASRNGIAWPDGPRKYGWVPANAEIEIGPFRVKVLGTPPADPASRDALTDFNPLERYRGEVGPLPKVDLEFHYDTTDQPTWSVNRLLTLLGRSPLCKLRFDTSAVSGVHCGLLLTHHGLWAIDLLGRGGTKVDGENVRAVPLESGNEILVATFQIGVFYEEPADLAAPERLTDNAAESDTSMEDLESAFLRDVPIPETAPGRPSDKGTSKKSAAASEASASDKEIAPKEIDWRGSIFKVNADSSTLIVIPLVEASGFRYQQLHVEANALQRKFETKEFRNLVVDLSVLNYFGSELIGVLIRLARAVTNGNGRAAMCGPSPKMMEVLEGMRLTKLWPIFGGRDEALTHVKQ